MKHLYWIALGVALILGPEARAAEPGKPDLLLHPELRDQRNEGELFPNRELTFDWFGTYASRDLFGVRNDRGGGGLGVNYFFFRNVGLAADSYVQEWKWPYRVNASAVFRYPIKNTDIAPYVFGGGGRQFKYSPQWTLHFGGGMEFRLTSKSALFADGRRVFPEKTGDYTLVRAGYRVGF